MEPTTIFTLGHSDREAAELQAILDAWHIGQVVDVRSWPSSQRFPHFDQAALARLLTRLRLSYLWQGDRLGGQHAARPGMERHTGLPPEGQACAEAYASPAGRRALADVATLARLRPTVLLCAERDWRACHRRWLADWLVKLHGLRVVHLLDREVHEEHEPTPGLALIDGAPVYRGLQLPLPGIGA